MLKCRRRWFAVLLLPFALLAQDLKPVALPKPRIEGGKPLMQALKLRKSTRGFSQEKLSWQTLSDLLWDAWGVNRPDGRRTAPSAMNSREIDVYVVLPDGAYLYEAEPHRLSPVAPVDASAKPDSALHLVLVEDQARFQYAQASPESKISFAGFAAGAISQNVYLFCASEGLATVVRASIGKPELTRLLRLRPDQRVLYVQAVGYPAR